MIFMMEFKEYLDEMRDFSNQPVTWHRLLAPFGVVGAPSHEDQCLLVGHVLDALAMEVHPEDKIDAEDVMKMADDLGFEM